MDRPRGGRVVACRHSYASVRTSLHWVQWWVHFQRHGFDSSELRWLLAGYGQNALGGWRSIFRGRILLTTSPRNKEQNSPSPKPERLATSAATTSRYRPISIWIWRWASVSASPKRRTYSFAWKFKT